MLNRVELTRYYHETANVDRLHGVLPYYQICTDKIALQLGLSTQQVLKLLSHQCCLKTKTAQEIENTAGLSADLLLKIDADYQRNYF
ncbi:XRE family transcriptional regulator [Secundilactobacillus pentosiphilus]|uniref:XRE family transcriptional regulator n=1 Tax=Secundilactobacillus pentosiphilus TaxID=1714682 RepID=A0A1Z5ILE1_9LACO|nr:hypothetical protein [Secundilactobacillus pentosiphilus]GAX02580.1 XRE family transcriptional regulator [Secundilactobacillus pentosiphilus]GAX06537.1 XRE family transcriptional regulator [Secundilactobacillus pentosiphilus]